MKRSEINKILRDADRFIRDQGFSLPPFAYWSPEDWKKKGPEAREIVETRLGWDITDFGLGDYPNHGLFLFTLRNGSPQNLKTGQGKLYAEKLLVIGENQETPYHFHWTKMEDIINRGRDGGTLMLKLYKATPAEEMDLESEIQVSIDGIRHTLPAGVEVALNPGESITVEPYVYHRFWAKGGRVLAGEVSLVNDDDTDNRFHQSIPRFPAIEEDEPPLHLLCRDYPRYYSGNGLAAK